MRILWQSCVNAARNTSCLERSAHPTEKWKPVFRKGHAPFKRPGAQPDSGCARGDHLKRGSSTRVGQCLRQKPVDDRRKAVGHLVRQRHHAVLDLDETAVVYRVGDLVGVWMGLEVGGGVGGG